MELTVWAWRSPPNGSPSRISKPGRLARRPGAPAGVVITQSQRSRRQPWQWKAHRRGRRRPELRTAPAVEASGLVKTFGTTRAIDGIDLAVHAPVPQHALTSIFHVGAEQTGAR